jgi:predicted small metal-binding protein
MKVIYCRDFGLDCNAKMKSNSVDDVVNATINHGVGMHGQNIKELQTPEKRAEIAAKIREE